MPEELEGTPQARPSEDPAPPLAGAAKSSTAASPPASETPGQIDDHLLELGDEIFSAWKELRRGAGVASLKGLLYGSGDDALDPALVDALELLMRRGAWRMSELAAALYVDASTATRTIDRLVNGGLAVRRQATDDARSIVVSATPKGRKQCQRIQRGRQVLVQEFLEEFTPEECAELASLMRRLVDSVNRSASRRQRSS